MSDFENIGDNSPTGADGTVDKAYEAFENGASIEEVNNILFGNETEPITSAPDDVNMQNADGVTYENDDTHQNVSQTDGPSGTPVPTNDGTYDDADNSQNGADSVINRIAENDDEKTGAAASDEKLFSQKELDLLVGRRLSKERRAHDLVKTDLDLALDSISKLLGVSREEALPSIKKAIYRREAEENNISDVDMYERLKIAEEKNAEYENAQRERNAAQDIEDFKNTITKQIENLSIGDSELARASANNEFNSLVRYFYDNPLTRDYCVSMAYDAYAKKNGVITPSQNPPTADAIPLGKGGNNAGNDVNGFSHKRTVGDAGPYNENNTKNGDILPQAVLNSKPKRVRENASSQGTAAPDSKMDIESMTLNDFDKIYEKVKRGETVMP